MDNGRQVIAALPDSTQGEVKLRGINLKISSYIEVLLSVSSAVLLTFLIQPLIQETVFAFFIAAVAVSTWYGGTKPGLLAIFLSTLAINYFFIKPAFVLYIRRANELGYLLLFILVAGVITWLILTLRTTKKRLEASMDQLKKTESRFRRLAESNIIGVVIGELHGQIFEANVWWDIHERTCSQATCPGEILHHQNP